jgi:hypothetical protein
MTDVVCGAPDFFIPRHRVGPIRFEFTHSSSHSFEIAEGISIADGLRGPPNGCRSKRIQEAMMHTKRTLWLLRMLATAILTVPLLTRPTAMLADNGNSSPTLSFFSGGLGAHADWFATADQPPSDTDNQAIRLLTVNDAPTFAKGYAGILFHHVTGIPAAAFPDSSFWLKTPTFTGPSLGSPRLVVSFQDEFGNWVGDASLRPLTLQPTWQEVSDGNPNSGWDVRGGNCGFLYNVTWPTAQACFSSYTTLAVYMVADAYGIYHLIDDIEVNGKRFSSGSDNGGGNNDPAGPLETTDPSLLPPVLTLVPPQ